MLTEGSYTVNRQALIKWFPDTIAQIVKMNLLKDLINGGEYIITAEDLMEFVVKIPAPLINEPLPEGVTEVHHSIINIVYKSK
jgi:hypothetical protein